MKLYVLETNGNYLYAHGCSLNKKAVEDMAETANEMFGGLNSNRFFVVEYEINNEYTDFNG